MRTTIGLLAIGLVQSIGGVFLYRGRIISDIAWFQSDILVFLLPFLLGAVASGILLWTRFSGNPRLPRLRQAILGGVGAAAIAEYASILVAFNRYGT